MTNLNIIIAAFLLAGSLVLSGCFSSKKQDTYSTAPPAETPKVTVVDGTSPPSPSDAKTAKVKASVYSDSLLASNTRKAGSKLNATSLQQGNAKWVANKGVTLTNNGATASQAGGAHITVPKVAGTLTVEAEIKADGSGFTGIALGRNNLSSNFWKNLVLLFYIKKDKYALFSGKKDIISKRDSKLFNIHGSNKLELTIDTVKHSISAKVNGKTVIKNTPLPDTVKTDTINALGFRINNPVTAGKPKVRNFKAEAINAVTAGLKPLDLSMFFITPNQKTSLTWNVTSPSDKTIVPYIVKDYEGKQVASGTATMTASCQITLDCTLPRGYFEIDFTDANQQFGIVSLNAFEGPRDPFFCMDSAITWLELRPEMREALIKSLARCGIAMSRERLTHGSINPDKNKWNWEGGKRKNESMRQTYVKHNVPILEILSCGGRHVERMKQHPYYPQLLAETSRSWTTIAKHWQSNWGGVEVYNEPDLRAVPADQYSTLVKTASYAVTQAGSKIPLVSGVFASMPPGPFFTTFADNGVLDDSNAVSLHSYDKAPDVEGMFIRYRKWLKKNGKEALPLWHTECGWSWRNGPARPPVIQDAYSALEITAKSIETKACGAECHFPFVYVYYEEGQKNFAMMGREVTPLRSMAGYAVCTNFLSGKDYLGDVTGLDESVKLSRVFGHTNSNECIVYLYTGKVDANAAISFPGNIKGVAGIDGRKLEAIGNKIPIPDGLSYVWTELDSLESTLKTDTTAAKLFAMGQNPLKQTRTASPIVFQYLFYKTPLRKNSSKYLVSHKTAKALPITVRIHNLSDKAINATPSLQLPAGGKQETLKQVTVPAGRYTDVNWTVDASQSLDITGIRMLNVTAECNCKAQPTPLAIPMIMSGDLSKHLERHASRKELPIRNLKQWQTNNANHGKATFSIDNNNFKMDIKFSKSGNRWVYPIFYLKDPIDPSVDSGFLVRARIRDKAGNVAIMANPNNPEGFWMRDIFPADGEWHTAYIPFEDMKPGPGHAGMQNTRLNPAKWNRIAVGMGSHKQDNTLEISDIYIVGKTRKK